MVLNLMHVIFRAGNSLEMHADDRKKDIVVHGKGPTDESDETTVMVEAKYSTDISKFRKKMCLSLYCNGANSFSVHQWCKNITIQSKGI